MYVNKTDRTKGDGEHVIHLSYRTSTGKTQHPLLNLIQITRKHLITTVILSTEDKCILHLSWAADSIANTFDERTADLLNPGVTAQPCTEIIALVSQQPSCTSIVLAQGKESLLREDYFPCNVHYYPGANCMFVSEDTLLTIISLALGSVQIKTS